MKLPGKITVSLAAVILSLQMSHADVVVNEVYGGGGNSGAPFNQDYVEIFNNGLASVDISGFLLQYGSATGAFNTFFTLPTTTVIPAGGFFTI